MELRSGVNVEDRTIMEWKLPVPERREAVMV